MSSSGGSFISEKFASVIAVGIFVAWAFSFFLEWQVDGYRPPASVHPLMMLMCGSIFAGKSIAAFRNGAGTGDDKRDHDRGDG